MLHHNKKSQWWLGGILFVQLVGGICGCLNQASNEVARQHEHNTSAVNLDVGYDTLLKFYISGRESIDNLFKIAFTVNSARVGLDVETLRSQIALTRGFRLTILKLLQEDLDHIVNRIKNGTNSNDPVHTQANIEPVTTLLMDYLEMVGGQGGASGANDLMSQYENKFLAKTATAGELALYNANLKALITIGGNLLDETARLFKKFPDYDKSFTALYPKVSASNLLPVVLDPQTGYAWQKVGDSITQAETRTRCMALNSSKRGWEIAAFEDLLHSQSIWRLSDKFNLRVGTNVWAMAPITVMNFNGLNPFESGAPAAAEYILSVRQKLQDPLAKAMGICVLHPDAVEGLAQNGFPPVITPGDKPFDLDSCLNPWPIPSSGVYLREKEFTEGAPQYNLVVRSKGQCQWLVFVTGEKSVRLTCDARKKSGLCTRDSGDASLSLSLTAENEFQITINDAQFALYKFSEPQNGGPLTCPAGSILIAGNCVAINQECSYAEESLCTAAGAAGGPCKWLNVHGGVFCYDVRNKHCENYGGPNTAPCTQLGCISYFLPGGGGHNIGCK